MRSMLFVVVALAINVQSYAAEPKPIDVKAKAVVSALETFCGTWEIIRVQPPDVTNNAERLVFHKDQTYAALDAEGKELWAGTFDLDPTASPKIWDHRSHEAQQSGGDALGIYHLDGDRLKLGCVVGTWKDKQWDGKPRPQAFALPMVDVVLELQRVRK